MKAITVIAAGLIITCTTALRAENVSSVAPISYREILWTNESHAATNGFPMSMDIGNDAQLVFVFQEEAVEIEQEILHLPDTNTTLLDTLTEKNLLGWQYGVANTNGIQTDNSTNKKPVQIVVFEPLNSGKGMVPARIKIHEYSFYTSQPKPAWHEWINPRLILAKWADFWANETNATPVVLVLVPF